MLFSDFLTKPPIIIPVKAPTQIRPRSIMSLKEVFEQARSPGPLEYCGYLKEQQAFSHDIRSAAQFLRNFGDPSNSEEFLTTIYIKFPNTPVVLPPILEPYIELIHLAMQVHYGSDMIDRDGEFVGLNISQKFLQAGEYSTFSGRHMDLEYDRIAYGTVAARDCFLVSDVFPTVFYEGGFNLRPVLRHILSSQGTQSLIKDGIREDIDDDVERLIEEQTAGHPARKLKPYEVVRFTDFHLHEAQPAEYACLRTMASVVFGGAIHKGEVKPSHRPVNNNVLLAYFQNPQRFWNKARILPPAEPVFA